MSAAGYSELWLVENDLPRVEALYSAAFGAAPDLEVLRWKYFRNPHGAAVWVGIEKGSQIVASGAMVPEEFSVFGIRRRIFKCTDLMVHPEHQRLGLAKRVIGALKSEIRRAGPVFSYTLCAKHATPGFVRNGFINRGELRNYFRLPLSIRGGAFLGGRRKTPSEWDARPLDLALREFHGRTFEPDGARIEAIRSPEFLRWRVTNPRFEYSAFGVFRGGEALGYCICGESRQRTIHILDAEILSQGGTEYDLLLDAVETLALKRRARFVTAVTHVGTRFSRQVLAGRRFLRNPYPRGPLHSHIDLNICVEDSADRRVLDESAWEIYALNYDDL